MIKTIQRILLVFCVLIFACSNISILTTNAATKKYTITYNANGGKGTMSNTTVTYGTNTSLRANSYKKTGYSFTGWTAYRASDKKWFCKNGNTKKWMTASQMSANKNYTKYLYKNKAVVAKTSSVNNDKVTMYAQWKQNTYTKMGSETIVTNPILLNEHGWTAFSVFYKYRENYVMNDTNVTYKYRSLYSYAETSRASWDNPYGFSCSNIYYVNSSGKKIQKFNMNRVSDNIFPGNAFSCISKENRTSVTYKRKNNNFGQFSFSITSPNCNNPYAKSIKYSLNV